jgi:3-oxoisoapionate decarboxylase
MKQGNYFITFSLLWLAYIIFISVISDLESPPIFAILTDHSRKQRSEKKFALPPSGGKARLLGTFRLMAELRTFSKGKLMNTRREFLKAVSTIAAVDAFDVFPAPAIKSYGIAYTSFPIRSRQARQAAASEGPAIPAGKFIELCQSFGASGCQMDFAQLASTDKDYLKQIRTALDQRGIFMELAVSTRLLADANAFAKVAAAAHELGVTRLRVALLGGRRYEDFREISKWREFVANAHSTLEKALPLLEHHKLAAGIENHKDWLADEQVALLRRFSSPYLGACVDFGNNLALLEDSIEVAQKLAPFVVTTHVKDMAVKPYADGFELSEVPLGNGITPLARIVSILRAARSDVHFCLEMITRDPLKVPYKTDAYWITHQSRDDARVRKFEETVLKKASSKPLPKVTGLDAAQALALEDENLRRCSEYARRTLKL